MGLAMATALMLHPITAVGLGSDPKAIELQPERWQGGNS